MATSTSAAMAQQASLQIQTFGTVNGLRRSSVRLNCFQVTLKPLRLSHSVKVRCAASPETVAKVVKIVTKQLAAPEGKVKPESKFEDLGADSLDQVEIVMTLEEEFGISVDEQGSEAIKTVQDAADLIERMSLVPKEKVTTEA
jgi:acyl carrier protein